jgi:hypothetical protein
MPHIFKYKVVLAPIFYRKFIYTGLKAGAIHIKPAAAGF